MQTVLKHWMVSCVFLSACAESGNFSQSFQPKEVVEEPLGPLSPIVQGTAPWYGFAASLRRSGSGSDNNFLQGEAQISGYLCISVDTVEDTSLPAYKNQSETKVSARTYLTGENGGTSLDMHDRTAAETSLGSMRTLLAPLWLPQMVLQTPYNRTPPTAVSYRTQTGASAQASLEDILFFDVRALPDKTWSGWEYSDAHPENRNFLNLFLSHFLRAPYDTAFYTDPTRFSSTLTTPPPRCNTFTDPRTCARENCTWTTAPGQNQSACLSLYALKVVWRETVVSHPELQGEVFHQWGMHYDPTGMLVSVTETLVPATEGLVPKEITSCSEKCFSAHLIQMGTWKNAETPVPCAF